MQNYQLWRGNAYEEGLVFRGSAKPPHQGGGVQALPSLGVPFYLRVHPLLQNYQIWCDNTRGGRGMYLAVSHTSHPKSFSAPQFWGFSCHQEV